MIFSQFGKIRSCEVVKDWKTGESLQYGFVEFETARAAEEAYFKMQNCLVDNHRIKVDFSQSVSALRGRRDKRRSDRHELYKQIRQDGSQDNNAKSEEVDRHRKINKERR